MKSAEPQAVMQQDPNVYNLQEWRERILQILLIVILVVGIPMYISNIPTFIGAKNWAFLIISTLGLIFSAVITFLGNKVQYDFRAITVITISYVFSLLSFQNYGLTGDARIWLLFFVVFSTIMLGLRSGLIASGIGTITYIAAGYLILNSYIILQVSIARTYSLESISWITAGFTLLFASLILSISIGLLIQGLERSLAELQNSYDTEKSLSGELENERITLEKRSQDLERRVTQIRAAAEISRSFSTVLDSQDLLQNVADLIKTRFDLYYIGVFLIDENNRYAVLTAGTGEPGQLMLKEEHKLSVGGSSMVGWTTAHGKPRIALDVGQEAIRFKNPHLLLTRSELALPIAIGNQILGAISVQSTEPEAFDEDDIVVLQGIADSLAIAIENANLFNQFEESLKEIQHLNRQYLGEAWTGITAESEKQATYQQEIFSSDLVEGEEVIIPLVLRGDQIIGNITLETDRAELHPEEQDFIDAISTQAAMALESARLLEEANKRLEREQSLHNLTTKFAQTLDFDTLLQTVVMELGQLPIVREASIHITPPDDSLLVPNQSPDSNNSLADTGRDEGKQNFQSD